MNFKRKSEKKIEDVLNDIFSKDDKLSKKYRQFDMDLIWRDCLGATISKYTTKVHLRGKQLTVYIESAPLKEELSYRKAQIIDKINGRIDYFQINKLIIR